MTRERAAAALAAWRGDCLGLVAHLLAEVERLGSCQEGEKMTTDEEEEAWLKPSKVQVRRAEDGSVVLQIETAAGVTFLLPMRPATTERLAQALIAAAAAGMEAPRE